MLEQVLRYLNNWFLIQDGNHSGTYTIEGGSITLPYLVEGQYFRIAGSVFNDGLHQYPANDLTDETFKGSIWALAVPRSLLAIVEKIEAWETKYGEAGPYQSESFGGYTYSRATNSSGNAVTWQDVFSGQLAQWKKLPGSYQYAEANPHMTPPVARRQNPWR